MNESNAVRDLTIDAKWETDLEKQKSSIQKLGSYGKTAIPSLEEIMIVTSREEIRQFCIEAIKGIQETNSTQNGQFKSDDRLAVTERKNLDEHPHKKSRRKKSSKKRSRRY
jgi:hypothetical protein